MNKKKMEEGVKLLLTGMGVDLADRNYKDTPRRVAKMYTELFTPKRNNFKSFVEKFDELVLLRGHEVSAVCPHHLVPVRLRVYLGYLPNGKVLGLSKLARIVEDQLRAPVLQEAFTYNIVKDLSDKLNPRGVACIVAGRHGCMQHRGVKTDADVVTSRMLGVFLLNPTARAELMQLIGKP